MGGVHTTSCRKMPKNQDMLNVVTLSDSAVQRLPLEVDDNPIDKEKRKQSIDDYWRDRLDCLETTYDESKHMTEKEFRRLEQVIKNFIRGKGKLSCPRVVEDTTNCYLLYGEEALKCSEIVRKLQLCLDTMSADSMKKQYRDGLRKSKTEKRKC